MKKQTTLEICSSVEAAFLHLAKIVSAIDRLRDDQIRCPMSDDYCAWMRALCYPQRPSQGTVRALADWESRTRSSNDDAVRILFAEYERRAQVLIELSAQVWTSAE